MTKKQKSEFIRGAKHGFYYLGWYVDYGFTFNYRSYLKDKVIDAKKHDIATVLILNGYSTEYAEGYKMAFYFAESIADTPDEDLPDMTLRQYLTAQITRHIRTVGINQLV